MCVCDWIRMFPFLLIAGWMGVQGRNLNSLLKGNNLFRLKTIGFPLNNQLAPSWNFLSALLPSFAGVLSFILLLKMGCVCREGALVAGPGSPEALGSDPSWVSPLTLALPGFLSSCPPHMQPRPCWPQKPSGPPGAITASSSRCGRPVLLARTWLRGHT